MVLCGNKVDIKVSVGQCQAAASDIFLQDRKVKAKMITFHRKKNILYCETSAKSNYNFEKPFVLLARKLCDDQTLRFVSAPALAPPETQIDPASIEKFESELQQAADQPFPIDDDEDT